MFDVGTPRDQERLFGDTGRREPHFLPPLSRNEPANDMRLCFTRYSFGVWDRHSAPRNPHVPSIIRLRLETWHQPEMHSNLVQSKDDLC